MTLSGALASLMKDSIGWEARTGMSASQAPTYAASKTALGRIEQHTRLVRDAQGREVASNTRLFLRPRLSDGTAFTPKVGDRFTLPAGYDPQQPPVISVQRENDEVGLHHWVVNL